MESCPQCGNAVPAGEATCPSCGFSLSDAGEEVGETRDCLNCGERIAADVEACPACGHLYVATPCAVHHDRGAVGQCVVCGRTVCEECDRSAGRHHRCPQHEEVEIINGWAEVYSTSDDIEAQLIQGNLGAEGIDAQVLSQKDHYSFTVDLGDLSPVRVLVPAYRFQDAQRVLHAHMDGQGELAFACPNCGEPFDAGERVCSQCGAELPRSPGAPTSP